MSRAKAVASKQRKMVTHQYAGLYTDGDRATDKMMEDWYAEIIQREINFVMGDDKHRYMPVGRRPKGTSDGL